MASSLSFHHLLLISTILCMCLNLIVATTATYKPSQPKALVIPLSRDGDTLERIIKINQRTPPVTIQFTVDLQGEFLWLDCDQITKSSTNRRIHCDSARCSLANSNCNLPNKPCKNLSCNISLTNPVKNLVAKGDLYGDVVRINSTDGTNPVRVVSVPRFSYGCGHTSLLQGLSKNVKGIAGLGRTKLSLPTQFSSYFRFVNKFAMCVSSTYDGVIIFGDKPYNLLGGTEASTLLTYTPLLTNHAAPSAYYIGVTSVKIGQNDVQFDKALLSINSKGIGGTTISTVAPYTIMHSSIYKAVISEFVTQIEKPAGILPKRVKAIAPFKVCYEIGSLPFTRLGVIAPDINLVMGSESVVWSITGTNSMVNVNSIGAYCLGVVDGGVNVKAAIVIGSYQLENNLLQFDLVKSRLGFTNSSLLFTRNRCDSFNFTSA